VPRRPIPIRTSLIRNVVLLLGLTTAALIAVTLFVCFRAVERVSRHRIRHPADLMERAMDRFFGTVRKQVLVGRG